MKTVSSRLEVHIQPNSSRNKITGYADGVLKVKITAPPVEGKANQKLIEFLSDVFDIAKSNIKIASGLTGKRKILDIDTLSPEEIRERLERLID
jgi:uncharacterized protein